MTGLAMLLVVTAEPLQVSFYERRRDEHLGGGLEGLGSEMQHHLSKTELPLPPILSPSALSWIASYVACSGFDLTIWKRLALNSALKYLRIESACMLEDSWCPLLCAILVS